MKILPKELQREEFRFCLLGQWNVYCNRKTKERKIFYPTNYEELKKLEKEDWVAQGKVPQDKKWQTRTNYNFNSPQIQNHSYNIGIVCGFGSLRIIDADKKFFAEYLLSRIPDTFIIQSGSGGLHFYVLSDYAINNSLKLNGEHVGEFRANCQQCVVPSSRHPLGTYYKVHSHKPIKSLSPEEIKEILTPYIELKLKENRQARQTDFNGNVLYSDSGFTRELSKSIDLSELSIKHFGKVCCPNCETDGHYFSYSDSTNLFKCWGCGAGGNIIQFLRYALQKEPAK